MKKYTGKIAATLVMLFILAAILNGCGMDSNGVWHFEFGNCAFTGMEYDGFYIDGYRVCTNTPSQNRMQREIAACKQDLTDNAEAMGTLADELLPEMEIFIVELRKGKYEFGTYVDEEYVGIEPDLSEEALAAIEQLYSGGRVYRFSAAEDENGLSYVINFDAYTPGYMVNAHYSEGGTAECSDSSCQLLDNGWCFHKYPKE